MIRIGRDCRNSLLLRKRAFHAEYGHYAIPQRICSGARTKDHRGIGGLNFLQVQFHIEVRQTADYSVNGRDEVEFMISTNPGEPMRPIGTAASGGELSRIMLAVKAVLAEHDEISTLIFDEIDVGISGRTAQKVAEKMALIGGCHQVICISHLAQIAAMADTHYLIEKNNEDAHTATTIYALDEEQSVQEHRCRDGQRA